MFLFTIHSSRLKTLAIAFCCFSHILFSVPAQSAPDQHPEARAKWMAGYQKMDAAEKTRRAGNYVLALEQYQEARQIFKAVLAEYPDWNTSLLTYRINYCNGIISRLNETIAASKETMSKEALVTLTKKQSEELKELKDQVADAERQMKLASESLERARREAARNAAARQSVDGLMDERQQLSSQNKALTSQVAQLKLQLNDLKANAGLKEAAENLQNKLHLVEAERQKLKNAADAYQERSGRLERSLQEATIERERLKIQAAQLEEDLAQVKKAAEVWAEDNLSLRKQIAGSKAGLQQAEKAVQQAEKKATSHATAVAQLREEIQQLREFRDKFVAVSSDLQETRRDLTNAHTRITELQQEAQTLRDQNKALRSKAQEQQEVVVAEEMSEQKRRVQEQTATIETLQNKARSLEDRLQLTEQLSAQRLRDLTEAQQQIKNVDQLGELLQEREKQVTQLQAQLEDAEVRLTEQERLLDKHKTTSAENGRETARARDMLAQLNQENKSLRRRVGQLETGTLRKEQASDGNLQMLQQQKDAIEDLRQKNETLARKETAQLAILRRQEDEISTLNRRVNELQQTGEKGVAAAEAEAPQVPPEENVVKLQNALATATEQLQETLTYREYAHQKIKDLTQQLESIRQSQAKAARTGTGQTSFTSESDLRSQLHQMNEQLEREKQRANDLEQALAHRGGEDTSAVPEPTLEASAHETDLRKRREQQTAILVDGLLEEGVSAEKSGNQEAAVWNYQKALEHDPKNILALQRLGIIAITNKDHGSAERYLRLAFYQDPDDLTTLTHLGFTLVRNRKPDLAISMLSRAVALNENEPHVHRSLGIACSSLGWSDAAEAQFRRTLALDDQDSDATFNLAVLLAAKEPPAMDEATRLYRKARDLGVPADPKLDEYFGVETAETEERGTH